MRVDTNLNRKPFDLTQDKVAHLNACAAQGMSFAKACEELGCHRETLLKAADRAGLRLWLKDKFPGHGYANPRVKVEQPARESLHFRAATMSWRGAA